MKPADRDDRGDTSGEERRERRRRRRREKEALEREERERERAPREEDAREQRPYDRDEGRQTAEVEEQMRRDGREKRDEPKGTPPRVDGLDGERSGERNEPARSSGVTSPPRDKEAEQPVKGILRPPREKFPEDPAPVREGVAPLKDAGKKGIPPNARWTKIDRKLVNPEALEEGKERFEERLDYVIVLRVLTKEEIQEYAARTQEIRGKLHAKATTSIVT